MTKYEIDYNIINVERGSAYVMADNREEAITKAIEYVKKYSCNVRYKIISVEETNKDVNIKYFI